MRCCVYIVCVHVVYAMLLKRWYRQCCVNIAYGVVCMIRYAVLCTDDAMHILDIQCYIQGGLRACCTCDGMYIWHCVPNCTSGVVCIWCCVHVVQVALCAGGVVYMLCMWRCVHVVHVALCT